jgi:hypothetical protein
MRFLFSETSEFYAWCSFEYSDKFRYKITPLEIVLYVWFLAFAYDELGEFIDAGSIFYAVDIWNGCDLIIIIIGAAFGVTSKKLQF